MIAMVENEYRSMADDSLEELREDVGVQKVELSRIEIQTGGK
jgi:hypothetical protein